MLFEHRRQREDVAHVVVDDQHALAVQRLARLVQAVDQPALGFRQLREVVVQRLQRAVEKLRHRMRFVHSHEVVRVPRELARVLRVAAIEHQLHGAKVGLAASSRRSRRGRPGETIFEDHAVELVFFQRFGQLVGRLADDVESARRPICAMNSLRAAASFMRDQQFFLPRQVHASCPASCPAPPVWIGFSTKAIAPERNARPSNRRWRSRTPALARGHVLLQAVEHAPAVHVGQVHVQRDRARACTAGQRQRARAHRRDEALEALRARGVEQEPREREVVLDDEQHGSPGGSCRGRRRLRSS